MDFKSKCVTGPVSKSRRPFGFVYHKVRLYGNADVKVTT
jgi:hypothetical protein